MSSSSDLQALFANLRPRPASAAPSNTSNAQAAQPPISNASSFDPAAFFTRQSQSLNNPSTQPQPKGPSPMPGANSEGDRAQSLLSLLKSGKPANDESQARGASENMAGSTVTGTHARGISASDLVAGFMNSPSASASGSHNVGGGQMISQPSAITSPTQPPTESAQAALLKLLNRTQSSQAPQLVQAPFATEETIVPSIENDAPEEVYTQTHTIPTNRKASPIRVFGSTESRETTPFALQPAASPALQKESQPLFTYTNPFEALTAMSRNHTPQPQRHAVQVGGSDSTAAGTVGNNAPGSRGIAKENSPEPSGARKKLTPRLRKASSTPENNRKETVADKLGSLADQASRAADEALAEVTEDPIIKEELEEDQKVDLDDLADQLQDTAIEAAVEMKQELDKPENEGVLEQELPTPLAHDVRAIIDSAAKEAFGPSRHVGGNHVTAREVPVYNFPIKPFVSITLNLPPQPKAGFRDDGVMKISRFKKEFDQLDRTLAAATSKYIAYALVKSGGMRVIRQDDGSDRQVFKNAHDRVFNIAMCATATNSMPTEEQAILGTGLSGAVYYATIFRDGNDLFEQDTLESESLIFPPFPLGDENTSGGQLKTRAKKSSRHPEFFAIGRGKHIHLIWPTLAMSPKYGIQGENRRVDIEKFYLERTLKITTGKAGKDFSFSEDDTTIVSLDKTGRLRFWDIRRLVDETNATAPKVQPIDIRIPLLTLSTASANEKVWPTSALFIDKLRPYSKATALRYVLVGLRQNHSLQLWDIGLGKAVQEINFPHSTENDGICSINYHPGSGIIVVGHPTRNSIYFIHLSAPRYSLPPMNQATYLERLAVKDTELPKPESTACMSGIREVSFSAKGQLRSVELLPVHKSTAQNTEEPAPLFELYVVHSRGVTCLGIKKQDLGWSNESKTLHPVDALEEGFITMRPLELVDVPEEEAEGNNENSSEIASKLPKKRGEHTGTQGPEVHTPAPAAPNARGISPVKMNGQDAPPETQSKKKKKKAQQAATLPVPEPESDMHRSSRSVSPQKLPNSVQEPTSAETPLHTGSTANPVLSFPPSADGALGGSKTGDGNGINVGISGDWLNREMKKLETGVTSALRKDFDHLHRQIDMERKVQDAAAGSRQEAMLRLISETLSDNVEKSLARIVISNFQQSVIPTMTNVTLQAVESGLVRHLHGIVPNEIGKHFPAAISASMSNPQTLRMLTDNISQKIAHSVENAFTELLHTTVTPSFKNLAINTAETMSIEVERRVMQQLQTYEAERQVDRRKIDDVMDTVNGMAKTLSDMARSQIEFQQQILQDRRASQTRAANGEAALAMKSPADVEVDAVRAMISSGEYQEATLKWLKSSQQARIFDEVLVQIGPGYLATQVAPLVRFSVSIALSSSLPTNTRTKIEWIGILFQSVDIRDAEIAGIGDHAGGILTDFVSRLETCYMSIHQHNMSDPILKAIPSITKRAKELRHEFGRRTESPAYGYGV